MLSAVQYCSGASESQDHLQQKIPAAQFPNIVTALRRGNYME